MTSATEVMAWKTAAHYDFDANKMVLGAGDFKKDEPVAAKIKKPGAPKPIMAPLFKAKH